MSIVSNPLPFFSDVDGSPLDSGSIYVGEIGQDARTYPVQVYWDSALTITATQPIPTMGGYPVRQGAPAQFFVSGPDYSVTVLNKDLVPVFNSLESSRFLTKPDLAAGTATSLIGWIGEGAGSVLRTLRTKLLETLYVTPGDFGADSTGVTNTTTAMKAFFDYCILTGKRGFIPAGEYKITPGQLFFDNGGNDKAFPEILTAGHSSTIFRFDPASSVDAPMFVITNGRAGSANPGGNWTGGDGKYWEGGGIGGISILDEASTVGTYTSRHGFELQGWTNPKMGYLYYKTFNNGSAVFIPRAEFDASTPPQFNVAGSTNPDPCAISDMQWQGIEASYSSSLIKNNNGVGMDGWKVGYVRAIQTYSDVITDIGQGCQFPSGSFGGCNGWVLIAGAKATVNRLIVNNWEVDNCRYGFDFRRITDSQIGGVRTNHRYNSPANIHNTGEGFWPRIAFRFAEGASGNATDISMMPMIHRVQPIEAGVDPAGKGGGPAFGVNAFGTLLYTVAPGSVINITYDHNFQNSAGFSVPTSSYHSGFNGNSRLAFTEKGLPFLNYRYGNAAEVSYTGTAPVIAAAGSITDAASLIAFNSLRHDQAFNYNTTTYLWTAPYTGWCKVSAAIDLTLASGTRVRMAVIRDAAGNGVFSASSSMRRHSNSTEVQSYHLPEHSFQVNAGDRIGVTAIVAGGVSLTPEISAPLSCWARYEMLGE